MNIYTHELKAHLRSVINWSIALILLLFVFTSLGSSFTENNALLAEATKNFPKELLMMFGMESMDWSSILGYYGLIFTFCQVCLAVQAANYGFGLVSIEETERTADFLVAKPVRRATIMTAKLLAAFTGCTITNAVVWIASFGFLEMFNHGEYTVKPLVVLLLSIVILQLFFLAVGMVISLLMKRVRSVTPLSMALVFGLYILNAFGKMLGSDSLEVLSPFKHFDPNYIIRNSAYEMPLMLVSVAAIVLAVPASYLLYQRRNIATAS